MKNPPLRILSPKRRKGQTGPYVRLNEGSMMRICMQHLFFSVDQYKNGSADYDLKHVMMYLFTRLHLKFV